jgi:hypothetical protein
MLQHYQPGMFSSSSNMMYNEVQGVTGEAATSMLATISGKRAQLHDTQWKTMRKNSLGLAKKETDLFKLIEAVDDSSVPAFDQQDCKIRSFMYRRHYDTNQITNYLEHGLLPTITRCTYEYFLGLLNKIRQLFYTHHHLWEGGPAKAMLDFHSKGLAKARSFSSDYQTFILKVYVYLREASEKGVYHASMAESLWSRVSSLDPPGRCPAQGSGG